jgi:hypothetical protein
MLRASADRAPDDVGFLDVRAADLQEKMAETLFVPPDPTKTAATGEHRNERSEQSNAVRCASSKAK